VPTISSFYGIVIRMFYDDHNPPHFHAEYGDYELVVSIFPLRVIAGSAPPRVRSLVFEWAALHREALLEDWTACKALRPPLPIPPLD
jgi:hypothetical protein